MNCVYYGYFLLIFCFLWSWPIRSIGCVRPHSYCFIPALVCGEHRKAIIRLPTLDSRNAELDGGFPSNPILSSPRQTPVIESKYKLRPGPADVHLLVRSWSLWGIAYIYVWLESSYDLPRMPPWTACLLICILSMSLIGTMLVRPWLMCLRLKILGCYIPWTKCPLAIVSVTQPHPIPKYRFFNSFLNIILGVL